MVPKKLSLADPVAERLTLIALELADRRLNGRLALHAESLLGRVDGLRLVVVARVSIAVVVGLATATAMFVRRFGASVLSSRLVGRQRVSLATAAGGHQTSLFEATRVVALAETTRRRGRPLEVTTPVEAVGEHVQLACRFIGRFGLVELLCRRLVAGDAGSTAAATATATADRVNARPGLIVSVEHELNGTARALTVRLELLLLPHLAQLITQVIFRLVQFALLLLHDSVHIHKNIKNLFQLISN